MKRIHLILLITILPFVLFSQEQLVEWEKPVSIPFDNVLNTTKLKVSDNKIYFIHQFYYDSFKKNQRKSDIITYDVQKNTASKSDSKLSFEGEERRLAKILRTKSNTFAMSYDITGQQFKVLASKFENENMDEAKLIYLHPFFKLKRKADKELTHYKSDIEFEFKVSQDSSKVVFANQNSILDRRDENDQISIATFDEALNVLWAKHVQLPYGDTHLLVRDIQISNNGEDVFLLCAYTKKTLRRNYEYKIFHITKDDQKEYEINLKEDLYATSLDLIPNPESQIVNLVGLYKGSKFKKIEGIFSFDINTNTKEISPISYTSFSLEENFFFNRIKRVPYSKKIGKRAIYSITDTKRLSNGNLQCIVECRDARFRAKVNSNENLIINYGLEYRLPYFDEIHSAIFQELVFITLDPKGNLLNTAVIERTFPSNDFPGYSINYKGDKVYVVINSKISEREATKYNVKKSWYHMYTKLVSINEHGKITKDQLLFTTRENDQMILFNKIMSFIKDDHLILGGVTSPVGKNRPKSERKKVHFLFGKLKL